MAYVLIIHALLIKRGSVLSRSHCVIFVAANPSKATANTESIAWIPEVGLGEHWREECTALPRGRSDMVTLLNTGLQWICEHRKRKSSRRHMAKV